MLPTLPKRVRATKAPDTDSERTSPIPSSTAQPPSTGPTPPALDLVLPLASTGPLMGGGRPPRSRGQPLPLSGAPAGGAGHGHPSATPAVAHEMAHPHRSLLPAVIDTSGLGAAGNTASPGPPHGQQPLPQYPHHQQQQRLVSEAARIRAGPVSPNHHTLLGPGPVSPADTQAIQLLQYMQQLLQGGVSTAAVQQWVSCQLTQASAYAAAATASSSPTAATLPASGALRPGSGRPSSLSPTQQHFLQPPQGTPQAQPPSPVLAGSSRPPRRPVAAVSFTLQGGNNRPEAQLLQNPQHGVAEADGEAAYATATPSNSSGGAAAVARGEGLVVSLPVGTDPVDISNPDNTPPLSPPQRETGTPGTAGRGFVVGGEDHLVGLTEEESGEGFAAHPPRGGVLRSQRPVLQHPQWRSFRSGNGNTSSAVRAQQNSTPPSSTRGTGGTSSNSGAGASGSNPSGTASPNAHQPESPARQRSTTSMQHATKVAIHATTSQFVAEEQKSITVLLGERFSRYPEMIFKRRIEGAQPSTGTGNSTGTGTGTGSGSPVSPGAVGLPWGSSSRRAHHGGAGDSDEDTELDGGNMSDTSEVGRIEASGGSAAAMQTRSPSAISATANVASRGALTPAVAGDSPLGDATSSNAAASFAQPRALVGSPMPGSATTPSLLAAAMESSDNGGCDVSTVHLRRSTSDDPSSMSIGSNEGDDAHPARPRGVRSTQDFSTIATTSQSRGDGSLKQQARHRYSASTSSNLSSAAAAASPIGGAAVIGLNNAAASPHDGKGEHAAETDTQNAGSLIEVDMDASGSRGRESQRLSGPDSNGERHSPAPGRRASVTTVNPFAWVQLPSTAPNTSTGVLASSLSQIAWSSAAAVPHRNRAASLTPRRTASLISTASSQLGCGASVGQANASFTNFGPHDSTSLRDDLPSLASSRTAGVSLLGEGTSANRRRRSSVLHLSRSSINGGVDPTMEGIMASFILDDIAGLHGRQGPRFMRSFCRHTRVRATESVTQEALEALGVPFMENINQSHTPVNVLWMMNAYGFTTATAFYVAVCLNVLLRYAFVQRFGWNVHKLKAFLETAATFFRTGNPAHNAAHAADMMIAGHQWLSEGSTGAALSDEEVMAFLFSAAVMQLAHTGADNGFLAQLKHPYAMLCSYTSPQHGVAVALVMALLNRPELHFFPAPVAPLPQGAAAPKNANGSLLEHEWTASRESQLYHSLAELILAADERNHLALKQNIVRIGEENARRHGCLCACVRGDRSGSLSATSRMLNRSVSPAESAYVRPQNPSSQGNFCLNCCAYITDSNVPDVLKAVMQFMDFAYLFRPYEVYVFGLVSYIAEVYRQSEVEYKLLERQRLRQEESRGRHRDSTETVAPSPSTEPPVPGGTLTSPLSESGTSVKHPFENMKAVSLCPPAVSFATALLAEDQPWRQGVARTSTVTMLQRNGEEATPVPPPPGTAAAAAAAAAAVSTAVAAAAATGVPPPSRRETAVTPPSEPMSMDPSVPHSLVSTKEPPKATAAVGTATPAPAAATANAAGPPPAAPSGAAQRVQPLRGLGRDIVLISIEELSLPFVEQLTPYIPESWVAATMANNQALTRSLPSPEEWDNALNHLLDLGEMTEEEKAAAAAYWAARPGYPAADLDSMATSTPASEEPFTLPLHLLGPLRPMAAEWTVNKDGLVRRVLQEILRGPELLLSEADME